MNRATSSTKPMSALQQRIHYLPVLSGTHTLLLHVIATQAGTSGKFVWRLPNNLANIDSPSLNALTIVLISSDHALQSSVLCTMLRKYTPPLMSRIAGQTNHLALNGAIEATRDKEQPNG